MEKNVENNIYMNVCVCAQSCPTLCNLMNYTAHQAPLFMGFSSKVYWSGVPFPPPGYLPDPGIKPESSASAGGFFITWATWEANIDVYAYTYVHVTKSLFCTPETNTVL